jgi:hypothetical protein
MAAPPPSDPLSSTSPLLVFIAGAAPTVTGRSDLSQAGLWARRRSHPAGWGADGTRGAPRGVTPNRREFVACTGFQLGRFEEPVLDVLEARSHGAETLLGSSQALLNGGESLLDRAEPPSMDSRSVRRPLLC